MAPDYAIRITGHGPGPFPPIGTAVPHALLEFLHQAYPAWDYKDTSAHETLARSYPAGQVTERVSREIRAACGVERPFAVPDAHFLCYRIFFSLDRQALVAPAHAEPLQPTGGLWDRFKGKGHRTPSLPASRPVLGDLWICSLGPYASFSQPINVLEPNFSLYEQGRQLLSTVPGVLAQNGVELVPWEVLDIAILDMRGTPVGTERSTPTVYNCLFERLS